MPPTARCCAICSTTSPYCDQSTIHKPCPPSLSKLMNASKTSWSSRLVTRSLCPSKRGFLPSIERDCPQGVALHSSPADRHAGLAACHDVANRTVAYVIVAVGRIAGLAACRNVANRTVVHYRCGRPPRCAGGLPPTRGGTTCLTGRPLVSWSPTCQADPGQSQGQHTACISISLASSAAVGPVLVSHAPPQNTSGMWCQGVVHLLAASERRTQRVGVSRGPRRAGRRRRGGIDDASQKGPF